jgi:protein transport protein DSL1/ZW10
VFAKYASSKTTESGKLLAAAAPSILDLYRALYPIAHSSLLAQDSNLVMRWSNDCKFVSTEVTRLRHRHGLASLEERWSETVDRLDTLGDSYYETAVVCPLSV